MHINGTIIISDKSSVSTEAVARRRSLKKVFLNISQNSQENTCARVTFLKTLPQVFSSEFCKIFKNTFFYRTPPVAASDSLFNIFKIAYHGNPGAG